MAEILGKIAAIMRAIAPRVVIYGCIAFVVWFFAGLPWPWFGRAASPPVSPPSQAAASTDPGWPHVRGANFDAVATNSTPTDAWPAEGPPVLWSREIGRGFSGVIAVGNRLYTQAQSLTEQTLLALDADSGQTLWEHRYGWPYDPGGMYPGPRATPTWSNGDLYFAAPDGLVGRVRAADGQQIWSVNVNERFGGRGTDFGFACSPLVEDGKVVLSVGGSSASVVALDAGNGATIWASGDAPASYCSVIPITFQSRRQAVALLERELAGFDLKTGRLLWRQPFSSGYNEHAAFPLYDEPYLRVMQPFRAGSDLYMLEAVAEEKNATENFGCHLRFVRHDAQMSNDVASSVLVNGYVYGFDVHSAQTRPTGPSRGVFRCMDFKAGNIAWSSDQPGHATIAVAGGKLLLFNDRGELFLLRANPKRYEELARAEVFRDELCWTAPTVDRDRVYLRSPTRLACLYVGTPSGLDRRKQQLAVPTSALPKARRLEVRWLVGAERENPFELPDLLELRRWYVLSLAVIVAAGLFAAAVYGLFRLIGCGRSATIAGRAVLWCGLVVFGVVATPLGNFLCTSFLFTWPLSLMAVHQLALATTIWAGQPQRGKAGAWYGVLAALFLIVAFLSYYDLTRRLSLAPAWYFLPSFLAVWPLAIPAAWRLARSRAVWNDFVWISLTFSVYFWVSGAIMLWRSAAIK